MSWEFFIVGTVIIILHALDIMFTVHFINKASKKYQNPEEIEINFHKYFIKKFGMKIGINISFTISACILGAFIIWCQSRNDVRGLYLMLGMLFMLVYRYYSHWMYENHIEKKLIEISLPEDIK